MHETLRKAVLRLLAPLVRLLLRHGVSHAEFANWAKQAYVREAGQHFGIDGKAPTVSRIAIVTGINRKEVKRIRELPSENDPGLSQYNRAVRVVTAWLQHQDFQTRNGQPAVLNYGDTDDSFNQLVRRFGGDVPARAMLDELVRVGTVIEKEGRVSLVHQGYVPQESETAMIEIFGVSVEDLLTTLENNLNGDGKRRLQMSVAYDAVSNEGVKVFEKLTAERAMQLLKELDTTLASYDKGANPAHDAPGKQRIGLGLYWIQDTVVEENTDHD